MLKRQIKRTFDLRHVHMIFTYSFLGIFENTNKISQRLQHGFTLPHNLELMYVCHRGFCWLLSTKAHFSDMQGTFWAFSESCSWISMGILSAVSRVLVTGLKAEVWTCIKGKQLNTKHVGHLGHADMSKGINHWGHFQLYYSMSLEGFLTS